MIRAVALRRKPNVRLPQSHLTFIAINHSLKSSRSQIEESKKLSAKLNRVSSMAESAKEQRLQNDLVRAESVISKSIEEELLVSNVETKLEEEIPYMETTLDKETIHLSSTYEALQIERKETQL